MTGSTRTPHKGRPAARPATGKNARAVDPIPTVEEAKRRLAAACGRERPWLHLTPEFEAQMAEAEDAAGGWLVGPEIYRPSDAE
jgi:hypothetical protein